MPNAKVNQAGEYLAKVTYPLYGFVGKSKEKKTPFIRLPLEIVEEGHQQGSEIDWYGYLSEGAIGRTTETLANLFGWDGNVAALVDDDADPFTGKTVRVTVEEEEYDGKVRYRAKWINDPNRKPKGEKVSRDMFPGLDELTKQAKRIAVEAKAKAESDEDEPPKKPTKDTRDKHIVAKGNAYQKQFDEEGDEIPF